MRKRTPLLLALVLIGTGSMLAATSAQAENVWSVLGKAITETKKVSAKAKGELKLVIAAKGTEFRCASLTLDEGLLLENGGSSGTFLLSECSTYLSETLSKPCKPAEPIAAKFKGSLIEHSSTHFNLVSPASGSTLMTLKFSEPCPLPDEVAVTGSLVLECVEAACSKEQATHTMQQASEALFASDGLVYMGHKATLAGAVIFELSDSDKGKNWMAGLPHLEGGNWRIEGVSIAVNKAVVAEEDSENYVLSIQASGVELACNRLEFTEGLIKPSGLSSGELAFKECVVNLISPLEKIPCTVEDSVHGISGEIHFKVEDKLLGHEGKTYDLFFPAGGGSTFATLKFLGAECPLPEEVSFGGSFVMMDCGKSKDLATEAVSHLVEEAPAALFPSDGLKFGKNPMTLGGSIILKLGGAEINKKWSGLA